MALSNRLSELGHVPPRPRGRVYRDIVASLWIICAVLSAGTAAASTGQRDTVATVTAFVNVSVVPMDSEHVLTGQMVLVQKGRITALGPVGQVRVPADARRIDGQGKFLIPGLADMHTHIAFKIDSADAEHVLLLLVSHGVTTIRNMDYNPSYRRDLERVLRFRSRAAAGTLLSPRIYTSGPWGPKQYTNTQSMTDSPVPPPVLDSVKVYVAEYKAAGYDFIKVHEEFGAVRESLAVAAHRVGIPFLGHVAGETGKAFEGSYEEALKIGYRSIEHLMGYWRKDLGLPKDQVVNDTTPIPGVVTAAAATWRAGVWNCPTLAINEYMQELVVKVSGDSVETRSKQPMQLKRRVVKALQDAGAGLLLGTDETLTTKDYMMKSVFEMPSFSVQDELAALVQAGLTPYQALVSGTRNVADYFGTLSESGTVTVGKRADLVLLDASPLVDVQNANRIAGVMLAGRWLPRSNLDSRLAAIVPRLEFSTWRSSR